MLIRFHGPFGTLAEKEVEIKLGEPISVKQLLQQLVSRYPKLPFHEQSNRDAEISASVIFIRNGRPIKFSDSIEDSDTVDIFIPLTGG